MARSVDLLQVEVLVETAIPHLHEQRAAEVKEFVLLVVVPCVGLLTKVLLIAHACVLVQRLAGLRNLDLITLLDIAVSAEFLQLLHTFSGRLHWYNAERVLTLLDALHYIVGCDEANQVLV